jgi:hypothetical protein
MAGELSWGKCNSCGVGSGARVCAVGRLNRSARLVQLHSSSLDSHRSIARSS